MTRGTPAQARRRERRTDEQGPQSALAAVAVSGRDQLTAAAAPTESPLLAEVAQVALAAMPACADCAHAYTNHLGTDGPCTVGECSCTSYVSGVEESGLAKPETATVVYQQTPDRLTFTLTSIDGLALPDPDDPAAVRAFVAASEFVAAVEAPAVLPEAPAPVLGNGNAKNWTAVLAPEGVPTADGRIFAPGSMGWRDLPITLMAMLETQEGHDGASVSGRIDQIWREGDLLMAAGVFDSGDYGAEIARLVADGTLRGVSVDIAIAEMDIVPADEVLDPDTGRWREGVSRDSIETASSLDVLFDPDPARQLFVVWEGTIGAATVCPFPAFAEASISLTAGAAPNVWTYQHQGRMVVVDGAPVEAPAAEVPAADPPAASLTAAAAGLVPVAPPAAWFANPELDALTPLVVTADGRVYGHAAAWDTCHIGIPGVCVTAPSSPSGYSYFHLAEVELEGGEMVACGKITLDTGHAGRTLSRIDATAHYDHTGTAVCDVVAGEDEFGIWVAGALRPTVDAEKVRELRGSVLSGDWRDVNGRLELCAILACNVPGFPVPRANITASGDMLRTVALIAAGAHDGEHVAALHVDPFQEIRDLAAGATAADEPLAEVARLAADATAAS